METVVHTDKDGRYLGQTRFAPQLLAEAIALAVVDVRGVAFLGKKKFDLTKTIARNLMPDGVQIERSKDSRDLDVNIYLSVLSGFAVADVAYRVQEAVINAAAQVTAARINRVNVYVKGTKYGASNKQK